MRERAQEQRGLCAHSRVSYRTEIIASGVTRGWWECASNCGTKFSPVQAPAEGVSPQPHEKLIANYIRVADELRQWIDTAPFQPDGLHPVYSAHVLLCELIRGLSPASVSPVEPTPEPPTGAPAPCVWRKAPRDRVLPGCKPERWFDRMWVLDFTHCPYCGHSLTMEPQEDRP